MTTTGVDLPKSKEAELVVLGSILLETEVARDVQKILSPEDFYYRAHQIVYRAVMELLVDHDTVDPVMVKDWLRREGQMDKVGGPVFLADLVEGVPVAKNGARYARIVAQKSILRKVAQVSQDALAKVQRSDASPVEIARDAADEMLAAATAREQKGPKPIKEVVQNLVHDLDTKTAGDAKLEIGLHELKRLIPGYGPGQMTAIGARPGMGKSALARRIAVDLSVHGPVVYFSLEESEREVVGKIMASRARKPYATIDTGRMGESDWEWVAQQANQLFETPIMIDDDPQVSMHDVRLRAREVKQKHGIAAVIIDYLQLMSIPGSVSKGQTREQDVAWCSRQAKVLARELECPLFLLVQLNRACESRPGGRPKPSDIRESGSIEQDADMVLLLHRPEYHAKRNGERCPPEWKGVVEVIVGKNRNGPAGGCLIGMDLPAMAIHNLSHERMHAYKQSQTGGRQNGRTTQAPKKEIVRKDWGNG